MKYGFDVQITGEYADANKLGELAADAEQAGWDGVFLWDVMYYQNDPFQPVVDPWVTLAVIAMKTQRIRIGALLTPLARRHPWKVARETVTLDHLSKGRMIFGAALGYQPLDFTPFGEEYDPKIRAEKLDEGLEILAGLWKGESFQFQGKHYRLDVPKFLPTPLQSPRIPVWIGGYWPNRKPFERAVRWDGVMPGSEKANGDPLTLDDFKEVVAYIKTHRQNTSPFDIVVGGVTPSDAKSGAEIVKPYILAGATWWIEAINDAVGTFDEMRKRIRSGPPKATR